MLLLFQLVKFFQELDLRFDLIQNFIALIRLERKQAIITDSVAGHWVSVQAFGRGGGLYVAKVPCKSPVYVQQWWPVFLLCCATFPVLHVIRGWQHLGVCAQCHVFLLENGKCTLVKDIDTPSKVRSTRCHILRTAPTYSSDPAQQGLSVKKCLILTGPELATHQFWVCCQDVLCFLWQVNTTHCSHIIDVIIFSVNNNAFNISFHIDGKTFLLNTNNSMGQTYFRESYLRLSLCELPAGLEPACALAACACLMAATCALGSRVPDGWLNNFLVWVARPRLALLMGTRGVWYTILGTAAAATTGRTPLDFDWNGKTQTRFSCYAFVLWSSAHVWTESRQPVA